MVAWQGTLDRLPRRGTHEEAPWHAYRPRRLPERGASSGDCRTQGMASGPD